MGAFAPIRSLPRGSIVGGKPELAQAGGKDAAKLGDALKKAAELGREMLAK